MEGELSVCNGHCLSPTAQEQQAFGSLAWHIQGAMHLLLILRDITVVGTYQQMVSAILAGSARHAVYL